MGRAYRELKLKAPPFDFAQGRLSREGREKWGTLPTWGMRRRIGDVGHPPKRQTAPDVLLPSEINRLFHGAAQPRKDAGCVGRWHRIAHVRTIRSKVARH